MVIKNKKKVWGPGERRKEMAHVTAYTCGRCALEGVGGQVDMSEGAS